MRLHRILTLAVPLVFVYLGQALLGFTDTLFLGHLNAVSLAAASLGNVIFFTCMVLGMGFVLAADPIIAQAVGAEDKKRPRQGLRMSLVVGLFASIGVMILIGGSCLLLPLLVSDDVASLTFDYLLGRSIGVVFFFAYLSVKSYLQAYGITRSTLYAVLVANLVNIPLDGFLIFGDDAFEALTFLHPAFGEVGFGFVGLGCLGSGIATAVASAVRFLWLLPSLNQHLSSQNLKENGVVERWKEALTRDRFMTIMKVGLPLSLQLFWEVGMFACITLMMESFSNEALAGHQVALQLGSTPFNVVLGIGAAASVLVGNEIGRQDSKEALWTGVDAIVLGALFMFFSSLFFFLMPDFLVHLFTKDQGVISVAVPLVQLAGAYAIFDGIQAVAAGALRGAGDTFFAFIGHALACWGFGVPSAYVLGFTLDLGPVGLWWGLTIGLAAASVILSWRFWFAGRRGYVSLES